MLSSCFFSLHKSHLILIFFLSFFFPLFFSFSPSLSSVLIFLFFSFLFFTVSLFSSHLSLFFFPFSSLSHHFSLQFSSFSIFFSPFLLCLSLFTDEHKPSLSLFTPLANAEQRSRISNLEACLSEVELSLTFPDLMRSKIIFALARWDFLLAWTKIKGDEVVRLGVVESTCDSA